MATVAQFNNTHLHTTPQVTLPPTLPRDTPFARETHAILHKTLFTILRERGRGMNGYGSQGSNADPTIVAACGETLIRVCNEFIKLHGREADRSLNQLDLSVSMLYQTYHQTAEGMFEEEITWGRIIAFVSFTIAVAERAYDMHSETRSRLRVVEDIETWLNLFFFNRLQDWIVTFGGWVSTMFVCVSYAFNFMIHCIGFKVTWECQAYLLIIERVIWSWACFLSLRLTCLAF